MPKLQGLGLSLLPVSHQCLPALEGLQDVWIDMDCNQRRKVRRRLIAPDGQEFGIAFATGTVLMPGDVLLQQDGKQYRVQAAPEAVLVCMPNFAQAVALAHALGNLHRDCTLEGNELLCLHDGASELLMVRHGLTYHSAMRPFMGKPSWEHA